MDNTQPNERQAGALALAEAVRRRGREHRLGQARYARLLADTYGRPIARIAEMLDVALDALERILAVDGVFRCVECCHRFHRSCMRELTFEPQGIPIPCECSCPDPTDRRAPA
ncbi:hypothetical protein GCM10010455_18050 [Microbacterium esteraromaticum]